jgi:hypothetical protein
VEAGCPALSTVDFATGVPVRNFAGPPAIGVQGAGGLDVAEIVVGDQGPPLRQTNRARFFFALMTYVID